MSAALAPSPDSSFLTASIIVCCNLVRFADGTLQRPLQGSTNTYGGTSLCAYKGVLSWLTHSLLFLAPKPSAWLITKIMENYVSSFDQKDFEIYKHRIFEKYQSWFFHYFLEITHNFLLCPFGQKCHVV